MPSAVTRKSWKPTKKWLTAAVTGVAAVLVNLISSGQWDNTETGMTTTLALALLTSYIKRNDSTLEGVPTI